MAVIAALTVDVVAIVLDLERLRRLENGTALADVGLDMSADISDVADILVPAAVVISGLTFGLWLWCAYGRLVAARLAELHPAWTIVGWLIPVLNLFRPPAIMRELATKPQPGLPSPRVRSMVEWWWGLCLAGAVLWLGLRLIDPEGNRGWMVWFLIALLADLVLIAAATAGFNLIGWVRARFAAQVSSQP